VISLVAGARNLRTPGTSNYFTSLGVRRSNRLSSKKPENVVLNNWQNGESKLAKGPLQLACPPCETVKTGRASGDVILLRTDSVFPQGGFMARIISTVSAAWTAEQQAREASVDAAREPGCEYFQLRLQDFVDPIDLDEFSSTDDALGWLHDTSLVRGRASARDVRQHSIHDRRVRVI
jgi:hypothetical protein